MFFFIYKGPKSVGQGNETVSKDKPLYGEFGDEVS